MPVNKRILTKYPNPVFVETGTYLGAGVKAALSAGFKEVRSIEVLEKRYEEAKVKFKNRKTVHLYLGDSVKILDQVISSVESRMTFWLDAHYSGEGSGTGDGETYCALLGELDAIKNHPIKDHTILIDDRRCMTEKKHFDSISEDDVRKKLLEINPNYRISYEDGFVADDIIVARISE